MDMVLRGNGSNTLVKVADVELWLHKVALNTKNAQARSALIAAAEEIAKLKE